MGPRLYLNGMTGDIYNLKLIKAEGRIFSSKLCHCSGPDNGQSPLRRQAIFWTNAVLLWNGHLRTKSMCRASSLAQCLGTSTLLVSGTAECAMFGASNKTCDDPQKPSYIWVHNIRENYKRAKTLQVKQRETIRFFSCQNSGCQKHHYLYFAVRNKSIYIRFPIQRFKGH